LRGGPSATPARYLIATKPSRQRRLSPRALPPFGLAEPSRHRNRSRRRGFRRSARLPEEMRMKSGLLIVVGTLIAVAGIVFGLQGLGYIGGSVMSGVTFWAVLGPLIALIGIALAVFGVRYRRSAQ
jgi:hypothetical protein